VNREQRRAARRAGVPEDAIAYAAGYRCADCFADTALQVIDGVAVLDVRHDNGCPALRQATHQPKETP